MSDQDQNTKAPTQPGHTSSTRTVYASDSTPGLIVEVWAGRLRAQQLNPTRVNVMKFLAWQRYHRNGGDMVQACESLQADFIDNDSTDDTEEA
jgi:hypothetical protein